MENNKETIIGPDASTEVDFETMEQIQDSQSEIDFNNLSQFEYDESRATEIKVKLDEKKDELRTKVYALSMTEKTFQNYCDFMKNNAEWSGTEALGVKEVVKELEKIKKDGGVKNSVIFLSILPLEASHYFLSKSKGSGLASAEKFLEIYKPIDQALNDAKNDVMGLKDLEKEYAAVMQGITLE